MKQFRARRKLIQNSIRSIHTGSALGVMKIFLIAASVFMLAACSTYVTVRTEPSGADVEINGQAIGQTPIEVKLSDFDLNIYRMTLTKLGYRDKTVTLQKELKPAPFIGGFVIWPFWLWCYGPLEEFSYKLDPAGESEKESVVEEHKPDSVPPPDNVGDVPDLHKPNPDAVGVVIGIGHYKNAGVPSVDYAVSGANLVKEYFEKTFGIDPRKIIFATDQDASLSDFKRIFEEQLRNYITPGKTDVYIYYQGHGVPDPESHQAYFVPYDCDPSYAKSTGYSLDEFYLRLSKLQARSLTIIIDACFSGASAKGMLLKNVSPLYIQPKNPVVALNNAMIFTSSTGEQVSCWFPEKGHSLFTYFFLKGLRGDADLNDDGEITAEEMQDYLTKNVPVEARYLSNREQTPLLMTKDAAKLILKYK